MNAPESGRGWVISGVAATIAAPLAWTTATGAAWVLPLILGAVGGGVILLNSSLRALAHTRLDLS